MSKVVRSVKNVTKGYSAVQVKVRNGWFNFWQHLTGEQLTIYYSDQQRSMGTYRDRYERDRSSDFQQVTQSNSSCPAFKMLIHMPDSPSDFYEIMDMLDKRLNDKGKNWRHVLKSLKVLDYCLHEGSELVVTWARKNVYIIKTLREFQYVDEEGRDVGQNGMLGFRARNPAMLRNYSPCLRERAYVPDP